MTASLLCDWSSDDFRILEKGVLNAKHRLAETGLFTDENLAKIIDAQPDEDLTISTMGHDTNTFEWREGDRNGVSGAVLLKMVREGHLWLNCRRMMINHPEFHDAVNQLYGELESKAPGFVANDRTANLLISSPDALVHYHMDMPVNMLWHVRGRKRVWVYPHFDHRFASQQVIEAVCSGEFTEDLPYDASFDRYALTFDVEPGQLLTWPQMAPHRVTNLEGLNVSLSTEHKNPTAVRRINLHLANQFLRRSLGFGHRSTNVNGPIAHVKQTLARAQRYAKKMFKNQKPQYIYPKSFLVDPDSPTGYRLVEGANDPIESPHLNVEQTAEV